MFRVTRRQMIRAGVATGSALIAGVASAAPKRESLTSFVERFLPLELTKADLQAEKSAKFTRLEFGKSTFWVGIVDFMAGNVPHAWIAIYAPHQDGGYRRSLFTESWAAGKIEASVDQKTGMLSLREAANSELKGQVVLACNLRTIGTQHSVEGK